MVRTIEQVCVALAMGLCVTACGDDDGAGEGGDAGGASGGGASVDGGGAGSTPEPDGSAPVGSGNPGTLPDDVALPIIFVHGFAGSAEQYLSQAMRFAANGYPLDRIRAYDHDGQGLDIAGYAAGTEAMIDEALADFDVDQVYLVGHSRGTSVSSMYLGDPARAAKVAKYISLDGRGCDAAMTAGVPCIAPSQAGIPGQAHVEIATSAESFAMQYEFLVGEAPEVVEIVAQEEPVVIKGRAVIFPQNVGRAGATLNVYEVDSDTGMRVADEPLATFEIDESGDFGPITVDSAKHYELALNGDTGGTQHFYPQRFLRSTNFVRLLSGDPETSATTMNTNSGEGHAALIVFRMREWYAEDDADLPGDERDVLEIATSSETGDAEPVDAIIGDVGNGAIALHIHDDAASPAESSLEPLPYFAGQPFQSGVDVYMPASTTPDGTITITNHPRGDADRPQVINVPNWASSDHLISIVFADQPQG